MTSNHSGERTADPIRSGRYSHRRITLTRLYEDRPVRMSSLLQRWHEMATALKRLRQSLRGGPGHRGARSDHFDGERFFNLGASAGKSTADLWRWRRTRSPQPWPQWREYHAVPQLPASLTADEIAITFVNHVTFLIQVGALTLMCDPVYSLRASPVSWAGPRRVHAPGLPFEQLPHIDLVFVSHNHYDHMDLPTLKRLARTHAPVFLTGLGNGAFLREQGIAQVLELDWWQQTQARGAQLAFTPAQHWSTRGPGNRNRTLWGGHGSPADRARCISPVTPVTRRCLPRCGDITDNPMWRCCRSAPTSRDGSCAIST